MERLRKFKTGVVANWKNPATGDLEPVWIAKCNPNDAYEPFYTIRIMSSYLITHCFESSLSEHNVPS